jgi:hypothetical protein
MAAFCGIPTANQGWKRMSRQGVLAEGEGFELSVPRRGLAKSELLIFAGGKGLEGSKRTVPDAAGVG